MKEQGFNSDAVITRFSITRYWIQQYSDLLMMISDFEVPNAPNISPSRARFWVSVAGICDNIGHATTLRIVYLSWESTDYIILFY